MLPQSHHLGLCSSKTSRRTKRFWTLCRQFNKVSDVGGFHPINQFARTQSNTIKHNDQVHSLVSCVHLLPFPVLTLVKLRLKHHFIFEGSHQAMGRNVHRSLVLRGHKRRLWICLFKDLCDNIRVRHPLAFILDHWNLSLWIGFQKPGHSQPSYKKPL